MYILGVVCCSVLVVVIWNKKEKFLPNNVLGAVQDSFLRLGSGNGFPYEVVGEKINRGNFKALDGDVIAVSDTCFFSLSKSAKELARRQHSFSLPVMRNNGNKILIYNLYGPGYQIESRAKTVAKGTTENNIICGAIASNGTYGFITESSGYFCEMTIYESNGIDKKYKFYFSEFYMIKMDFSSDGENIVAIGYSAEKGKIKSALYVFELGKRDPKLKLDFLGSEIIDVSYLENGKVAVVGDNLVSIVDTRTGERKDQLYENKVLTAFKINKYDGIIFSLSSSNDGSMNRVYRVNENGKQVCDIDIEDKVSDISCKSGSIAVLSYRKVFRYDSSGKRCNEVEVKNDAKSIEMFSTNGAYILGTSEIRKIEL